MPDYTKIAANALKAIAKAGGDVPLTRELAIVDPVTGEPIEVPDATVRMTLTAVIFPRYKGILFSSMDDALKTAMITGRAKTVLAAAKGLASAPKPQDVLTFEARDWRVVGVSTLAPNGTPLIHTMGVVGI